jgi:ABC-type proline/glycine betaine transport system substrate-binding protein
VASPSAPGSCNGWQLDGQLDLLLQANDQMAEAAVDDYIASHPAWVRYWVTGEIASG